EQERDLIAASERLALAQKLVEFSLTAEEWGEYKKQVPRSSFLVPRNGNDGLVFSRNEEQGTRNAFSLFEKFYEEAEMRDRLMAENLLKSIDGEKADVAILVTGGFHSSGVDRRLREQGCTVVEVTPRITKVETASATAYLSVFTQEKTPLDRLF